jgi:flagellin
MAQSDFTRINSNIGAMNALNSLKSINTRLGKAQLSLATGNRINEASDDPAGLTIATKLKYRSSGITTALDNIGDAKNLMAVSEGGLQKINDILITMRDKAVQGANDALGVDERAAINDQLTQYASQIDDIYNETLWNGNKLLDSATSLTFQTGPDSTNTMAYTPTQSYDSTTLTVSGLTVDDNATAQTSQQNVEAAIKLVSTQLSTIGSQVARLTFKEETLSVAKTNTEAAYSRVMNADMAAQQLESTKLGILQQTATAMLSQANQGPQTLLSLFR